MTDDKPTVGLTDEQIDKLWFACVVQDASKKPLRTYARRIEAIVRKDMDGVFFRKGHEMEDRIRKDERERAAGIVQKERHALSEYYDVGSMTVKQTLSLLETAILRGDE